MSILKETELYLEIEDKVTFSIGSNGGSGSERKKSDPKEEERKKSEPKEEERKKSEPKEEERKKSEPKEEERKNSSEPKDEERKNSEPKEEGEKKNSTSEEGAPPGEKPGNDENKEKNKAGNEDKLESKSGVGSFTNKSGIRAEKPKEESQKNEKKKSIAGALEGTVTSKNSERPFKFHMQIFPGENGGEFQVTYSLSEMNREYSDMDMTLKFPKNDKNFSFGLKNPREGTLSGPNFSSKREIDDFVKLGTFDVVVTIRLWAFTNIASQSALKTSIKNILEKQIESDIAIRVQSRDFHVHKNILSEQSPYFKNIFEAEAKKSNCSFIELKNKNLSASTFEKFISFIYLREFTDIRTNTQLAIELFYLGIQFQVIDLQNFCYHLLLSKRGPDDFTVKQILDIFKFCTTPLEPSFDMTPLKKLVIRNLKNKNLPHEKITSEFDDYFTKNDPALYEHLAKAGFADDY